MTRTLGAHNWEVAAEKVCEIIAQRWISQGYRYWADNGFGPEPSFKELPGSKPLRGLRFFLVPLLVKGLRYLPDSNGVPYPLVSMKA